MRHSRGFTLIELLMVVVIIGILAAIAIPKFSTTKDKAKLASLKTDLRNYLTAQESYLSDNGRYGTDAELTAAPYTFVLSKGNSFTASAATAGSWSATIENPTILSLPSTCTIQVGGGGPNDGVITCA